MNKPLLNGAVALCTIGGAVFAVGASEIAIAKVISLPARTFEILLFTGALLVGIGLCLLLMSFIVQPIRDAFVRVVYGDLNSRYTCVRARRNDLIGLHDLYTDYFGSDVPSVELMKSWISRCKTALMLVHRVRQNSGLATSQQLVGSFKVLPLTTDAVRALEGGQISGSTFKAEHIASNKKETAAVYVGDVVATSQVGRGMVLAHLNAACTPAVKSGLPIYARPLTHDGLRVMTKHGFVQVLDGTSRPEIGRICKLEFGNQSRHKSAYINRLKRGGRSKRQEAESATVRDGAAGS